MFTSSIHSMRVIVYGETRRFIYNWGREQWEKQYHAYKQERETTPEQERVLKAPTALALKKQFNMIRHESYPWTGDVTKCVVEGAFDSLEERTIKVLAIRVDGCFSLQERKHKYRYASFTDPFCILSRVVRF